MSETMEYPSQWLIGASLGEKIASQLRLRIIEGSIPPDTVLTENQMAAEFGTSRSPIRDCFKLLSNEGLIRLERMGAVVLGLTSADLDELYDIRFLIENFILQRLTERNTDALVLELNKIIDKMEIADKHDDIVELSFQDLSFHEQLLVEAGHKRILHLWYSIRPILLSALLVATTQRFSSHRSEIKSLIYKHHLLVAALSEKDKLRIEKLVQEHFEDTRKTVSSSIGIEHFTQS